MKVEVVTVPAVMDLRHSIYFSGLDDGKLFKFCSVLPLKHSIFGKKVAFYSKWRSNQEWRSITADTV